MDGLKFDLLFNKTANIRGLFLHLFRYIAFINDMFDTPVQEQQLEMPVI